jgi:signal transduction histidine kinase/ActR/RegA family two-component response regulator
VSAPDPHRPADGPTSHPSPQLPAAANDGDSRRRVEENLRFLAEATATLIEVSDLDRTLERIAQAAVPQFSDWSEAIVRESGGLVRRLATSHPDPAKTALAQELQRRYPLRDDKGAGLVLRTGEPLLLPRVDAEAFARIAQDADHLRLATSLGIRSYMAVPMRCDGEVLGVLTFATTESEREYGEFDLHVARELGRRAAIALRNAELLRSLKEADKRKDEFLAVLAHELRNPLAPIRNAIEIMRSGGAATPQLQWTFDVVERQVRQMTRLVDDLLDVARISSGKLDLRKERVEIANPMRMAVEACRPIIERSGHEITVRVPAEPIVVEADVGRLAQVFSNLLNNAAKFTPPGGHLWVTAEARGEYAVVKVRDNGMGISPDLLPKVFDMYTQLDAPRDRSQAGLGIGLTLVKRLVELHGGAVEAHSEGPMKGTTFSVRLPLRKDERRTPRAGDPAKQPAEPIPPRRILVVDDNHDAADSLAMLLRAYGHEVQIGYDGVEAVGAAVAFKPDVVFLDIGLPKLDGYKVAQRIREQLGPQVLLVAITGWGQEEDRRRSRDAGFDHHLTKPVDPEIVTRLVKEFRPAKE